MSAGIGGHDKDFLQCGMFLLQDFLYPFLVPSANMQGRGTQFAVTDNNDIELFFGFIEAHILEGYGVILRFFQDTELTVSFYNGKGNLIDVKHVLLPKLFK